MTCCSPGCWATVGVTATVKVSLGPDGGGDGVGGATPDAVTAGVGVFAAGDPAPGPAWLTLPVETLGAAAWCGVWCPRSFHAATPPPASTITPATAAISVVVRPPDGRGRGAGGDGPVSGGEGGQVSVGAGCRVLAGEAGLVSAGREGQVLAGGGGPASASGGLVPGDAVSVSGSASREPHLVQYFCARLAGVPHLVQYRMPPPQSILNPNSAACWPMSLGLSGSSSAVAASMPSRTAWCIAATVALADSKRSVW
jgi:hypothetical protein